MTSTELAGSGSLRFPDYWWYTARTRLLQTVLGSYVRPGDRILDVGSADGPSVSWLPNRLPVDIDPRGLPPGGVCASVEQLPFPDDSFDVVTAFDVVEHCADELGALGEMRRVVRPGGHVLLSVPAYQWAWTRFDERAGHHRRYTRRRLVAAVRRADLTVEHSTYAFTSTLPFFVVTRLLMKLRGGAAAVQPLPAPVERFLLALTRLEQRILRRRPLPAGSSVFLVARV